MVLRRKAEKFVARMDFYRKIENSKTRSVLKDSEANSFDRAELENSISSANQDSTSKIYVMYQCGWIGLLYCVENRQISGRPRAGEISRNIRGSDLRERSLVKF